MKNIRPRPRRPSGTSDMRSEAAEVSSPRSRRYVGLALTGDDLRLNLINRVTPEIIVVLLDAIDRDVIRVGPLDVLAIRKRDEKASLILQGRKPIDQRLVLAFLPVPVPGDQQQPVSDHHRPHERRGMGGNI